MISTNAFTIVIILLLIVMTLIFYLYLRKARIDSYNSGYAKGISNQSESSLNWTDGQLFNYGKSPAKGIEIYDDNKYDKSGMSIIPRFGLNIKYTPNYEKPLERNYLIDAYCEYTNPKHSKIVITPNGVSDGFHTFDELYYYRMTYNAAVVNFITWIQQHYCQFDKSLKGIDVIKSKKHFGGEKCYGGGWFIVMIKTPLGQISNHYELKDWDKFNCRVAKESWKWDGHSMKESTERLIKLSEYLKTGYWI